MTNRILTITLFVLMGYTSFSQETYLVKNMGTKYSLVDIQEAMSKADWCGFYFESANRLLNFDDGSVVQLKSVEELTSSEIIFDSSCKVSENQEDQNTYIIHSSGNILIEVKKSDSLKTRTSK